MIITDKAQIKIYELIESDLKLPVDATFTRSSVAYLSDGTQVAANVPRFEQGKFGQAVLVEEGTTNLNSDTFFKTGVSGWEKGNWTTLEWLSSEYNPFSKQNGVMRLYDNDGANGFCLKVVSISNTPHTVSVLLKILKGNINLTNVGGTINYTDSTYTDYTWNDSNTTRYDMSAIYGQGVYKLVATITPDSSKTISKYEIRISHNDAVETELFVYAVQLEAKPYNTSFIDGTRAAETLTIPTAGVLNENEFDITGWFIPAASSSVVPAWARIWALKGVLLTGLFINDSVICFAWNNKQIINTNISLSANDQLFYSVSKSGSNVVIRLAKNGGALSAFTGTTDGTTLGAVEIALGSSGTGASFYNGKHDDLRISNRARTDEEIAAAYASGQPLPVDEWTTYKLDFDDKVRITTQGQIICNELIEI